MENTEKKYLVQIKLDDEVSGHMMTIRELAEHYETDDICGIGYNYSVWDVDSFGMVVSVNNWYDMVQDYLRGKREMQQEYEDYCNELRYADWN